jgi:hypothetical protein
MAKDLTKTAKLHYKDRSPSHLSSALLPALLGRKDGGGIFESRYPPLRDIIFFLSFFFLVLILAG